ncbi:MAG: aminotransferase class III-fold pyridoxal phosphate-dependent enzyme [Phycisphaerales bacterium]|nr:aminotransferase class III-fold pyridoxal phosphate-dependent enzyme [Phycisphaerales bacterium]HCA38576.1 acetylornithine aminotransferase [Phycisphaerales bacterium]
MNSTESHLRMARDELIAAMDASTADITGIRPPDEDRVADMADLLARLADVRGRPAMYASIGSGRGRGALVELADGSVKWDMITGIGVNGFGHGDLELAGVAATAAVQDIVMQGNLHCNIEAIKFAETLRAAARRGGADMAHCYPACSGGRVNEIALKVCMQARNGAPRVIAFEKNFIGRTVALSHIGDSPGHREGIPKAIQTDYLPYWDPADPDGSSADALAALTAIIAEHPNRHACFVMELVQGEGGFTAAPREFFAPLLELARSHDIPVWFDEIQTFGRTDRMFRFEGLDLGGYADIVTVGKMTQGCGALWRDAFNPRLGLLSGTFLGSTAAMAVGTSVIDRLTSGDWYGPDGHNARLFAAFAARCEAMVAAHGDCFPEVVGPRGVLRPWGGTGGMMRLTPFGGQKDAIVELVHRFFKGGVLSFFCGHGPFHIRFLPPIGVLTLEQFDEVMDIVEAAIIAHGKES